MALVATLGIGNLMMTMLALVATGQLAKLTLVPYPLLAAALLPLLFLAAYNSSTQWGDILVVCFMGALGLTMKWLGWPRPPLILGFILGPIIEQNLWRSIEAFGLGILTRGFTITLVVLAISAVAYVTWALGRQSTAAASVDAAGSGASAGESEPPVPSEGSTTEGSPSTPVKQGLHLTWRWESLFTLLLIGVMVWALNESQGFRLESSRFIPRLMTLALLPLLVVEFVRRSMNVKHQGQIMDLGMRTGTGREAVRRLTYVLGWIAGYILAIGLVGMPYASIGFAIVFAVVNVHWRNAKLLWALVPALLIAILSFGLFDGVMHIIWPEPIIWNWLTG
jgi:cbb3-type cytochrome oxidase subunit 3